MGDSATEREGCIDQIRMVIAQLEAADAYICCPQFRCMQAEIMVLNGTILQALNEVSRGVELARSSGNQDFLPELLRLNGQLLYMQDRGQIQTSLQLFQEAAAIAANQGAVGQRIRALMSSVALLAGTGNDAGASFRSELREVLSEVPSDQQECDALLAQEMLDTATAEPVVVDGWWTRLLRRY